MKRIPKIIVMMLLTITTLLEMTSCATNRVTETEIKTSAEEVTQLQKQQKNISIPEQTETVVKEDSFATIVSFGDTLCHKPVSNEAYDEETGFYDFSSMFKYVEKYFQLSEGEWVGVYCGVIVRAGIKGRMYW